jgi:predicted transcriptional regulator
LSSGKKKIKIEIEDDDGGKYNLSLEGNISKTKLMKAIDFMGLINGNSNKDNKNNDPNSTNSSIYNHYKNTDSRSNEFDESDVSISTLPSSTENSSSLTSKIWSLIETRLSKTSFTSSDIVLLYKREYNEYIGLDKVATYLARYCEKGRLERSKRTKEWLYKMVSSSLSSKPKAFNNDIANSNHRDNVVHKYYPPSSTQIQATDFN